MRQSAVDWCGYDDTPPTVIYKTPTEVVINKKGTSLEITTGIEKKKKKGMKKYKKLWQKKIHDVSNVNHKVLMSKSASAEK